MIGCKPARYLLLFSLVGFVFARPVAADFSRSDYFDWGPYYDSQPQRILGITFSSLEELPAPSLPPEIIPAPATGILPGNPLYPAETFFDAVRLTFTFDAVAREQFRLTQATERLEEAMTLAAQNQPQLAAIAAQNYRATLEQVAQNLSSLAQNLTPEVTSLIDRVNQTTAQTTVIAQAQALETPPVMAQVWTDLTAGAATAMDAAADAAGQPPIPDTLSAQIQQLKDQGLITPEQAGNLYSLDTRAAVRDTFDQLVSSGQAPLSTSSYLDQTVVEQYPNTFNQIQDVLEFAELRTYQTLPLPPEDVAADLTAWDSRSDPTLPPPETIRPYLYYLRAQDLAQDINLTNFTPDHQAELAKFYPNAATQNPTYQPPASPSPIPSPEETTPPSSPLPSPSPIPPSVTAAPYLGQYTGPLPGTSGYFFKQAGETFRSFTTFSPLQRAQLNLRLANERLQEAAALASSPNSAAYQTTLDRYQTIINRLAQNIDNTDTAQDVEAELARHNAVLEKGILPPPPDQPEALTAAIRATENALDASADTLDRPPLPESLSNRLQDLKAQGLITPEEVDRLTQADSRTTVREELRTLLDAGSFPPADAKKLDEAQALVSPQEFNQLVEVRKIEELQHLRAIQSEFAQTATLRATSADYDQRLEFLRNSIDPGLIDPIDLAGQPDLLDLYNELSDTVTRPVNAGQFSSAVNPTDYEQYRCTLPNQYWSFVANGCVVQDTVQPELPEDSHPTCPAGFEWLWAANSCQPGNTTRPDCTESGTYWSQKENRCITAAAIYTPPDTIITVTKPDTSFIPADSPFAFLDRAFETVQSVTAFTPEAKARFRLAQARERFGESYDLLQRGKENQFGTVLGQYTDTMQQIFNDIAAGANIPQLADDLKDQAVQNNLLLQQASILAGSDSTTPITAATSVTIQAIDRAADLAGEPPIPADLQSKIQELPEGMLTPEQQDALLNPDSRLEARLALGQLTATGIISPTETAFLNEPLAQVDPQATIKVNQLKVLDEIANLTAQKQDIETRVSENENISQKLNDWQKSYAPGQSIPADIRPYLRLTRIDEIAQTVRPDIVKLEDFANRKDIQLAVASLQQEFKPTREAWERVEQFRRNNPNQPLPPELARIEAFSYSLGIRGSAETCFLPSPPFTPNTPCPPPGAPIPVATYYTSSTTPYPGISGLGTTFTYTSPSSETLRYGEGPKPTNPGACPDGYHFMYDSGGWCMSNSGNYSSNTGPGSYSSGSSTPGYTPYSPYYSAPGAPPYSSTGGYAPPNYYGPAPTTYTTVPPAGTVPGTGPAATAPGQCPSGYHWMSDSGGWCMANGSTYVPSGSSGPYSGPVTPTTSCPSGSYWSSYTNNCVYSSSSGTTYYSPNLTQSSCGPGYYWDGRGCIGTTPTTSTYPSGTYYPPSYSGGGSGTPCTPPPAGCGTNSWFDYGSCSCRSSSSTSTGSTSTYTAPSSGGSTSSSGSCPSGYHWMSDSGGWCMADGGGSTSTYTPPSSSTPTSSEPTPAPAPAPSETSSTPAPAPTESTPSTPAPTTSP